MIRPLVLAAAALAGCSPNPTPGTSAAPETIRIQAAGGRPLVMGTIRSEHAAAHAIPLPADSVYRLLPAVFSELKLEVGAVNAPARELGTGDWVLNGRLGRERLSTFVSCGAQNGIHNADEYQVTLNVRAQVLGPDATSSQLRTQVTAHARPKSYAAGVVPCSSTGMLERRLAERTRALGGVSR